MSISLSQIQHHQRILITGDRAEEIFRHCQKALDYHNRAYDTITENSNSISDGPIAFIISRNDFMTLDPHIVLVDSVSDKTKPAFEEIANAIPKSGTIVYNESDKLANEIGSRERTDVHLVAFKNDPIAAAKGLLKRIGVNEDRFDQAQ